MEQHNFKKDAWIFFGAFLVLLLLIPGLAWLAFIPFAAAVYYHFKQRKNHDR